MALPCDHKYFLDRRDFVIPPGEFTAAERALLAKYGSWLEALAAGVIAPLTETQEQFVRAVRGDSEPTTDFERAWLKVTRERERGPEVIRTFRGLADAGAAAAALEAEYREARSAVLAKIREELAAVDEAYGERLREATECAAQAESRLRELMLQLKHSTTLAGIRAVYSQGRVTYDAKRLEAYSESHPEVRNFRKVGKPVVALRFLDRLELPERNAHAEGSSASADLAEGEIQPSS